MGKNVKVQKKISKKKKSIVKTQYEIYKESLSKTQREELTAFFAEVQSHVLLTKEENSKIREDFESAILYYAANGTSLDEALDKLSVTNLGGFYARPPILWYPLDDAAKIYPLSMRHGQMSVFRLSVCFKQEVIPEILQMALTFTIKRFPSFATTVKKGFFWHYLDTAKRRYAIEPETEIPCRPLQVSRSGSQSFRVVYYNKRVSIEYFHVLTDGTGGMIFLKTLVAEYLRLLGLEKTVAEGILDINDIPKKSEMANEFLRGEKPKALSGFFDKPARQMSGKISKLKPCRILHFKMDAAKLKQVAKAKNTTITAYLLALLFIGNKAATDELEGDVNIQVPVNMRKFHPSDTLRNFSMYSVIKLPIDKIADTDMDGLITEISNQLTQKASQESMQAMMDSAGQMVKLMRYVPLGIKAPVASAVYGFLGDMTFSNTLSNLGIVKIPEELAEQIDYMDFILGTSTTSRAGCGLVTFENNAVLSVTKMTVDPSFEEKIYDLLVADEIDVVVEGSELYES